MADKDFLDDKYINLKMEIATCFPLMFTEVISDFH